MTWKQIFTSSVGKKITMGITGLFLISFLVIHMGINACIFKDLTVLDPNDNGDMFNRAADYMGRAVVIRIMELVLFLGFFVHIIQGLLLEFENRGRRKINYAVNLGNRGSKWYSRSMGLLGTILLLFLILHWWHFWIPSRFTHAGLENEIVLSNGRISHDMFNLMKVTFSEWWVVAVYVAACISLAYHLLHGFQSAFRTLGLSNSRYISLINAVGIGYSVLVPLIFALMPISMKLGWVGY
ncbi:MAG TPA: succinate dehydrogenase cytochrome b subunit [Chitinophagaceae bacterium]|nr:succinate dehydrogenase cytochrome b subunit [Chitinophagaceae bacterium]